MRRLHIYLFYAIAALLIAALAIAALTVAAHAATFRGKSVDHRWYSGSAFNPYAGHYDDVRIKFSGEIAFVRFSSGTQLAMLLRDEVITDPTEIEADDVRRDLHWILQVRDLGTK